MATTLSNGVVVPDAADLIPGNGVQAFRDQGASVNSALGNRALVGHTHSWGQIEEKPSTFPPAPHTHASSDVDGLDSALAGKVDDDDPRLTDARSPTAHEHDIEDVTGLAARLAALEYKSGRRNITALLDPAPSSGNLFIERRGDTVWLHMDALTLVTTSDTIYSGVIASGFQIVSPGEIPAAQRSVLDAKGGLRTYGSNLGFYYLGQAAGPFRGMVSWPTNQAIPTTLPGSPA